MSGIRLAQLPDRTPVKLTLHLPPELHAALERYAAMYEETYGRSEPLPDLIAAMLGGFLEGDRAFRKRCR